MYIEITSKELSGRTENLTYIPFHLELSISKEFGVLKLIEPKSGKPVP